MSEEIVVDARGLRCPLPVLMARRAFARQGAVRVVVLTDDPASGLDMPFFGSEQGLDCAEIEGPADCRAFRLAKREKEAG